MLNLKQRIMVLYESVHMNENCLDDDLACTLQEVKNASEKLVKALKDRNLIEKE